ncbi:unnamed protein product [Calypogeia fissa]
MKATAGVVNKGSTGSPQRVKLEDKSRKPVPDNVRDSGSSDKLSHRENLLLDRFAQILSNQTIPEMKAHSDVRFSELQMAIMGQLREKQQKAHDTEISELKHAQEIEIANLTHAKEVEMAHMKHAHGVEIAHLKHEKSSSLQEDRPLQQHDEQKRSSENLDRQQNDLNGDDNLNYAIRSSYASRDAMPQTLDFALSVTRFENESFNTMFGVSRFPHPNKRKEMFYAYYEQNKQSTSDCESLTQDPQFKEFCEMKLYSFLWKLVPHCNLTKRVQVTHLQRLGGPELVSAFNTAATKVWLLHKLAFSFELPATIFRVEEGADLDSAYMAWNIVTVEDNERFVSKVGFIICAH